MKIGQLTIEHTAALAPMAGAADFALRTLSRGMGAAFTVGEMASTKGLVMGDGNSQKLLAVTEGERPMGVQLFGDDPLIFAKAVELALRYRPDFIDINMGCPAPKVTSGGGGSALMKNLPLAQRIIEAAVGASAGVPVTVKMRKGWDDDTVNCVELAKIAESSGAAAVTVHGRTRMQMYAPPVDMDVIKRVKEAVAIPVIGNGDVDSAASCLRMYEYTGCDLVMVGRGALGNPFLFAEIKAALSGGIFVPPTLKERMETMVQQAKLACGDKGERVAMREMRKHAAWYMRGLKGASAFRFEAGKLESYPDIESLAARVLEKNEE